MGEVQLTMALPGTSVCIFWAAVCMQVTGRIKTTKRQYYRRPGMVEGRQYLEPDGGA